MIIPQLQARCGMLAACTDIQQYSVWNVVNVSKVAVGLLATRGMPDPGRLKVYRILIYLRKRWIQTFMDSHWARAAC